LLGEQERPRTFQPLTDLRPVGPGAGDALTATEHGRSILLAMSSEPGNAPDRHITVRHAGPLAGEVVVPGAKNSVLKLMTASLMADGVYEITNVPSIADVEIMGNLLEAIGVKVTRPAFDTVVIENRGNLTPVAPYELVEAMRASINVLGPLLARCGHVRLSMPGGDDFGSRPIDMHIAGLEKMGATFSFDDDVLEAQASR
jgi:UDP-N-acetylglucosamine 1-carboxyvinyltransferase